MRPEWPLAAAAAMTAEGGHAAPAPCALTAAVAQSVEAGWVSFAALLSLSATAPFIKAAVGKILEPPPRAARGCGRLDALTSSSSGPPSRGSAAVAPLWDSDASAATSGQSQ